MITFLAELKRLAQAATPGPWEWKGASCGHALAMASSASAVLLPSKYVATGGAYILAADTDKNYIAACSPERILALIDLVDFVEHTESCSLLIGDGPLCDCGLDAARAKLEQT